MKSIKVLGPGCTKCKNTFDIIKEAVNQTPISAIVEKVDGIDAMLAYDLMVSPAIVIDDKVVFKGKVPTLNEAKALISQ